MTGKESDMPLQAEMRRGGGVGTRRGAILLFIAVSLVALMSLLVMAVDAGNIQRQKRIAQNAADAGAQAGAIEIYRERTDSIIASARSEASRNGFTHGVGGRTVTVTWPNTGTFAGNFFVRVNVQDTVRTLFGGIIGRSLVVVNARAVGGVTGTTQACIVALDPDDSHSLIVESGGHVNAAGCNVAVNSDASDALCVTASEGGSLVAGSVSVHGGYDSGCAGTVSPSPSVGQPTIVDPLASTVSLQVSDTSGACIGGSYDLFTVTTDQTLNPGIYCGGIKAGKSTSIARFNPGLYIIKGGGLSVSGGGTVIGNGGVTIVTLNAPAANGGASKFDVVDFGSDANVSLTAPASGPWAGIVFYSPIGQGVVGHVIENQITSAANATITGSIYFPDQQVRLGSGGTLTIAGGVVAGVVRFRSDSNVNVSGFAGGEPYGVKRASVVE
jgi:hypothetical protein